MLCLHSLYRLCAQRGWIFDKLCLINKARIKDLRFVKINILTNQWIGSDPYRNICTLLHQICTFLWCSWNDLCGDLRCKFWKRVLPIVRQRSRTYDQGTGTWIRQYIGNCLQCLTKSHIICQNPTHSIMSQGTQPAISRYLIRPQYIFHTVWQLPIGFIRIFQIFQ